MQQLIVVGLDAALLLLLFAFNELRQAFRWRRVWFGPFFPSHKYSDVLYNFYSVVMQILFLYQVLSSLGERFIPNLSQIGTSTPLVEKPRDHR
jgi:hypothetical protein